MDIILLGKGKCSLYYLEVKDGYSLDSFLENQSELDEDAVSKLIDYLSQVTEVANCLKSLGTSVYKRLDSAVEGLFEIKKGRIRLICLEVYDGKTIIIICGFFKKDKKQQSKEIKKAEKYIKSLGLQESSVLEVANWLDLNANHSNVENYKD